MQNRGPYSSYFLKPFAQGWSSQYMWKSGHKRWGFQEPWDFLSPDGPVFFFEQHQYSHPQCKWCLKVLIQTYIDVASVRLTSTQGSGEKLLWPDRRSSAHSWKVWSMFVCLCVSERTCEWKLSVLCSFLGRIVGQKLQVERGSGRRFGYKLYKSGKKTGKQKSKKKLLYFFFSLNSQSLQDQSGSCYMFLIWACSV